MAMKLTYRSGTGISRYWKNESSLGSIVDGKDARVNELKFNSSNNRWEMTNNSGEVLAYNSDLKLDSWTSSYSYNLRFPAEYTPPDSGGEIIGYTVSNAGTSEANGTYSDWDGIVWRTPMGYALEPTSDGKWKLYDPGWTLMYYTTGSDVTTGWVTQYGETPLPTVTPIYAAVKPDGYQLKVSGTDHNDGIYTLVDSSMTGYNRVWLNTDFTYNASCIRWYDEYSDWTLCDGAKEADISNDYVWSPFDGTGNHENPWDGQLSQGTITKI